MPLVYEPIIFQGSQSFTPVLTSATPPSSVTYSKQVGNYRMVGNRVVFDIDLITSSITKLTGLGDAMRVTLPTTVGNGPTRITFAQAENTVIVVPGSSAEIVPGNNYLTIKQLSLGKLIDLTFGLLNGIGILSTPITIKVSGSYESA